MLQYNIDRYWHIRKLIQNHLIWSLLLININYSSCVLINITTAIVFYNHTHKLTTSWASTFAPALINVSTIEAWPYSAPKCKGVASPYNTYNMNVRTYALTYVHTN